MSKLKLGNDFTDEDSDQTEDINGEEEKEIDGDPSDLKKEEKTGEESIDNKDKGEEDTAPDEKEEVVTAPESKDKSAELQGLLDTEKDLDAGIVEIDSKITEARKRISDKRTARREKRDLVETIDEKFSEKTEETDNLDDIDSETIKVLDRYTRAKGLVPKSELQKLNYQEKHKSAEESFYEKHPEYSPENDTDDALYNSLKSELTLYVAPTDPKLISVLFEKAHNAVKNLHPEKFKQIVQTDIAKNVNKNVRLKTMGLGSGASGGTGSGNDKNAPTKKSLSAIQIRALEDGGWSEEDIKNFTS